MLTLLLTALVACGGDGVALKKLGSMACGDCCRGPAAAHHGLPGGPGAHAFGMPGAPGGAWLLDGAAFMPGGHWTLGWAPEMRGGTWGDGDSRGKRGPRGEVRGEPQVFVLGAGSKGDDEPQVFLFEHDGASGKASTRKVKVRAHAGGDKSDCGDCCNDGCCGKCEVSGGKAGPHTFNLKVPGPGHAGGPGRAFEWRGRDDDGKEIEVHVNVVGAGEHGGRGEPKVIVIGPEETGGDQPMRRHGDGDKSERREIKVMVEPKGSGHGGPHQFKIRHGSDGDDDRGPREFNIKLDRDDRGDGEHDIKVFVAPKGGRDGEKEIKVFVEPNGDDGDGKTKQRKRVFMKRLSDATGATNNTGVSDSRDPADEAPAAMIALVDSDATTDADDAADDNDADEVSAAGDEPGVIRLRVAAGADDEKDGDKKVIVRKAPPRIKDKGAGDQDASPAIPPVWIGVRMAPIPAPLAAHLGDKGLMVANVAKDSPADAAGVKQYDVILSFGGTDVADSNALVEAVQGAGAGSSTAMVVMRDGKRKELSIKPAKRPGGEVEYKYEEQDAVEDNTVRFRGGTLKPGPGGVYTFEDLGDLKQLPDLLKEHLKDLKIDLPHGLDMKNLPQLQWRMDLDGGSGSGDDDGDDGDAQVEVKIIKHGDDGALELSRSADGEITVKRTDKGGSSTTATYKDLDELREKDEEAARLMGRWSHGGGFMHVMPDMGQLPQLQRQWQSQIQKHLGQARNRIRDARSHMKVQTRSGDGESHTEIVNVQVDDDGAITVVTQEDGQREEHKFGSKKEMKANAPDLYEKYRAFLDE